MQIFLSILKINVIKHFFDMSVDLESIMRVASRVKSGRMNLKTVHEQFKYDSLGLMQN